MAGNWMNWWGNWLNATRNGEGTTSELDAFKAGFEAGNRMAEIPDTFWNDDVQYETPNDCEIMQGRELGEVFKLTAAWYRPALFKVVKVPDDESDDYAVEAMPSNAELTCPQQREEDYEN